MAVGNPEHLCWHNEGFICVAAVNTNYPARFICKKACGYSLPFNPGGFEKMPVHDVDTGVVEERWVYKDMVFFDHCPHPPKKIELVNEVETTRARMGNNVEKKAEEKA